MKRRIFCGWMGAAALSGGAGLSHAADQELRVLAHSSFSLPKTLLAQFESQAGIKPVVIKAGDAGEMLNKLILTRAQPIADVVFGIDNALAAKAQAAQVLDPYPDAALQGPDALRLGGGLVPVDYGYVNLNYDRVWVARSGVPLPRTLEDLTRPAYRDWLVVQNPATSSPGYAFLLATIAGLGEEAAFDWWARMRANGLKVAKGWSEAYYTDFSRNGGKYPVVVSYATSPAAELFYAKDKPAESPTANLLVPGGVFRQVEGVALVRGGGQRAAAIRFIEFLRSPAVQEGLQTAMWMYPAQPGVNRVEALRLAAEPARHDTPSPEQIATHGAQWVSRWTQVVLR
ncbi:MAG: thiamine ABC transporter substrate-binding protein [Rhodoferax sp.]|nr:thiamine ABC transporter substrate-binding protein [Rhodoferax sp.]